MKTTEDIYKLFLDYPFVCTDTRQIIKDSIFFALKGGNFNGNQFALKALEEGASFAIVDEKEFAVNERCLLVDNVLTALQQLANHHRKKLKIPVLAITGSNGKTTTKELTAAVLSRKYKTLYTKGNLNNQIGVPLTLLSITKEHEMAVIEMGANHQKEIEALCKIAEPNFGIITNIGKAHLEGFGGIEGVKKGKGEMYQYIKSSNGLIFINGDNNTLHELLGDFSNKISYGSSMAYDFTGNADLNNSMLMVHCLKPFSADIKTNLTGIYNFENVMLSVAVGYYFKVPQEEIKSAIENYVPSNQRSQVVSKSNKVTIVLDAYNANPSSMAAALDNFSKAFHGTKIVALGDMLELGDESKKEHLAIGKQLKKLNFNDVILVGPEFKSVAQEFNYHYFITSQDASAWIAGNNFQNCTILIKGSRGIKMELISEAIK